MKKVKQNQSAIPGVGDFINLIRQQSVRNTSRLLDHESFLRAFKGKETPDAELIEDYNVNRNEWAFDELYNRHKSKMLACLYGILHSWEDAKDVLQNAWEATLQYLKSNRYTEIRDFAGWFKSVCYRQATLWQRDRKKFFCGNGQLPDNADASINAEQQLDNRQLETFLHHAMNKLTENEKEIVILRIYQDKTFNEIAVMRQLTAKSASSIYCKALKKLKKAIS